MDYKAKNLETITAPSGSVLRVQSDLGGYFKPDTCPADLAQLSRGCVLVTLSPTNPYSQAPLLYDKRAGLESVSVNATVVRARTVRETQLITCSTCRPKREDVC